MRHIESGKIGNCETGYDIWFNPNNGLFDYEIDDQSAEVEAALTATMARHLCGSATLSELPPDIRDRAIAQLTKQEETKARLVAQTTYCDGDLVVSYNSF
jgi:hypothetical protein